jgi:hypothetical protein
MAVGAHLRGLVQDVHDLVEARRLLLDHRGHHHPRRGAADGAGQLRLGELHQPGVGRQRLRRRHAPPPRVGGEGLAGPLRAEEAAHQRQQLLHRGAAAQEASALGPLGVAEDVDEEGGLRRFRVAGLPGEGHAHVQPDVGEHAPEHAVGDVVEPRQPEELLWSQQAHPERALGQEAGRQPA